MACMTLLWAPVATLINSLPPAGSGPIQNRCSARPGSGIIEAQARAAPDKPDGRCAGSRIVRWPVAGSGETFRAGGPR
jgi:hypothetical protein